VRPSIDSACPTITATGGITGAAGVTHPTERRKFSIAELKRLCGFPDDFRLTGTYAQQWERLGRAVPPIMMSHLAATIREQILRRVLNGNQ
jgi:DNA (cytosine-5)-methyltransferase 1